MRKVAYPGKQSARLPGPLQKNFSIDCWTAAWRAERSDEDDDRLYKSGLWIYERWSVLHKYRLYLEGLIEPSNPRRQLLTWINNQTLNELRNACRQLESASVRTLMQTTISDFTRHPAADNLSSEAGLVLLGDAIPLILKQYGIDRVDDCVHASHVIAGLGCTFINLAQLIQHWEECLKLGYWVDERGHFVVFCNPRKDYSVADAIAADRRANHEQHLMHLLIARSKVVSGRLRRRVPLVTSARLDGGKLSYELSWDASILSEASLLREIGEFQTPEQLQDLKIPGYDDLRLRQILDAFEVLVSLGAVVRERKLQHTYKVVPNVEIDLPRFALRDLVDLLREALGCRASVARAILAVLTYKECARDGAWSMPLLPCGSDYVEFAIPVMHTSPLRLIEHLLLRENIGDGKRGRIYEAFIRKRIDLLCRSNPVLAGHVEVCQSSIEICTDLGRRDIDLLIRLENLVFVGEIKSTGRPIMPWEHRTYMKDVLETGPTQLMLRMQALKTDKRNQQVVAKALKFRGNVEDLMYTGAVIPFHYEASGCKVDGFPIVDFHSLGAYFASNVYELGFQLGAPFGAAFGSALLYTSPASAAAHLPAYLHNPLGVVARYPLVSDTMVCGEDMLQDSSRRVCSEQHFVRSYTLHDLEKLGASLGQCWSRIVAEHNVAS